ncbi:MULTISPECIES: lysophospholipid acyltransferase family protein [unclassified Rhodococcus (in: high G+C Gram-positive bacteria)]|uniref:lysophospholipid acyltransferase family protein n=1 Tax=unclassified Rhodococcus (in: high G+C Gram-positive bacteria) TaxID=192944 RepID=UPI000488C866|nr:MULTISPECIES: lysophospholipid acyltransferase family protein [unclassified Rhodococcus (in: high G+C Gram-positive bacteria)]KQU30707.1 acyl-phosphate glycerol 3-phosphate acyltransferase [Rhodococcus sp. Leaf225]KQU44853.1 acyl-phosphate glycerol 3-phosphate acyltransferase [Rhodococcus sp. Leaf258]MBY6676013.1 1-acyl-sn-glycerol-3-phosphate acyltransferase [Rhodococcus sp. BP-332]MBY6681122.1 1-acyl-sn-glycerol-3-phosphate acyltransferase [Rhodococcus sp. BP-316]MBY6686039.1 1-acyl-sn-gl
MWYWIFKYVLLGPVLQVMGRPRVEGLENIPDDGPVILASNHQAVFDSFYACLVVPRRITFLAKSEYFTGKGLKGRFQKWFFSSAGQVPIDRTGASAAQDALDAGLRVLAKNKVLGIYPEGTRSPDDRLYKGKTGMARLALESGVPVIPVAMIGTAKMNPIGSRIPRPTKLGVKFGKPLDFSRYEGMAGNRFVERAVTDEVMYELMKLSGQQYVDVYAASMKKTPAPVVDPAPSTEAARIPDTRAG